MSLVQIPGVQYYSIIIKSKDGSKLYIYGMLVLKYYVPNKWIRNVDNKYP